MPGLIRPAAAPERPVVRISGRIGIVPAPFPDIAQRVVAAKPVGQFPRHPGRAGQTVCCSPCDVVERTVARSGAAGRASEFPLGFGWQTIAVGCRVPVDGSAAASARGPQPDEFRRPVAPVNRVEPAQSVRRLIRGVSGNALSRQRPPIGPEDLPNPPAESPSERRRWFRCAPWKNPGFDRGGRAGRRGTSAPASARAPRGAGCSR